MLKLKLIRGKSIIFVNDVERGYRVKLFLEQFGVKTCVVNSELPLACRYHVVEEFNRGIYDVVVATDEAAGGEDLDIAPEESTKEEDTVEEENTAGPSKKRRATSPVQAKPLKRKRGDGSSLARGIDFTSASSVINFDLPTTSTAYLHRIGRTARAGHSGLALSFVVPKDKWGKDRHVSLKSAEKDEQIFERIKTKVRKESASEVKEWDWGGKKGEIEGFRYRMEDALKAVTGKRVADARREEVRKELLNSEKLKVSHKTLCRLIVGTFRCEPSGSGIFAARRTIACCSESTASQACAVVPHAQDCGHIGSVSRCGCRRWRSYQLCKAWSRWTRRKGRTRRSRWCRRQEKGRPAQVQGIVISI